MCEPSPERGSAGMDPLAPFVRPRIPSHLKAKENSPQSIVLNPYFTADQPTNKQTNHQPSTISTSFHLSISTSALQSPEQEPSTASPANTSHLASLASPINPS